MNRALILLCMLTLGSSTGCGSGGHGDEHGEGGHDHGGHGHDHGGHDEHDEHDEHGGGHGHGESAIGITRWTEALELFAEHPPAVVGHDTPFLAHLTELDGFASVDDAHVRLELTGPATLVGEADMLRPGIYEPHFTATVAGTYQATLIVQMQTELRVAGFEIEVYPDEATATAANPEEETPGMISFLKEQQWRVPFGTATASLGEVRATREVTGQLETPPGGVANVHSPIAGRVMSAARTTFPSPGDTVSAGQVLATMAPTPGAPEDAARAGLTVVESQARVEDARAELERVERMLADRAVPERRADEARRRLRVAEASLSAARRVQAVYSAASSGRGRGSWRIISPIDGIVDHVHVSPGEALRPDEPILRVVDTSVFWVRADVPEFWAARFRRDADGAFSVVGDDRWRTLRVSGEAPTATIAYIARSVDPESRTVRVIYALNEPDENLRVGAAVRVAVPSGELEQGIVVPSSAVDDVQGRTVIYVQAEGEAFEERHVRLGARHGEDVLVIAGLEAGERIVTRGAHLVHLASGAGEQVGHQHPH